MSEHDNDRGDDNRQVHSQPKSSTSVGTDAARAEAKRAYRRAVLEFSSIRREAKIAGCSPSWIARLVDEDEPAAVPSIALLWASSAEVQRAVSLQLQARADGRAAAAQTAEQIRRLESALQTAQECLATLRRGGGV
jgi:hypothetical protein